MVAPMIIGAGLAGAGLAGSLLGGSSVPRYNPNTAIGLAKQGEEKENNFIDSYMQGTKAANNTLRTDVNAAKASADEQSRNAAQDYLSNFDPITSRLVQSRTDALKQQLFGQIPELVQAAREAGAAGGGLDRGVTQSKIASVPVEQARQFNTGATNIANTALQGQLDARSKVYDSQNQLILNKLGIDNQTAEAILNSGNQALINQLNGLIDNSRNSIGLQITADSAAQGSNIGAVQNENANRQAIYNSLIGAGGALMGSGGGAAAVAPSAVTNATNNRSVIRAGLLQNQTTLTQNLSLGY